ncbi:hypothetical protein F2Q69_00031207 [Brassica cretica]|uniref:Uncharacterized protein n=1 Tax=Brassica cretica TaxID=69181 RepID=A0A8S9S9R0_BRACR|nr:hypothetical protein F2Q69_00031207 [Brassica cretica]
MKLQLKAFLILAQAISACSTSARKQDDLRQLVDSSRPDQHVGQLAFPNSAIRQLATTSARVPISSSSRFISLVVHSTLLEVKFTTVGFLSESVERKDKLLCNSNRSKKGNVFPPSASLKLTHMTGNHDPGSFRCHFRNCLLLILLVPDVMRSGSDNSYLEFEAKSAKDGS